MADISNKRLTRSETEKMIAGVCGGIAEFFDVDPTLVRIAFVLGTVFGGGGLVLYIAMWIIVPRASRVSQPGGDVVRENLAEGRQFAQDTARSAREGLDRVRRGSGEQGDQGGPGSQGEQAPPPPPPPPGSQVGSDTGVTPPRAPGEPTSPPPEEGPKP